MHCVFGCETKREIRQHFKEAHGDRERKYVCRKGCTMAFLTTGDRWGHEVVHETEKPHTCDKCGFTTKRRHALNEHIRNVHTRAKLYKCNLCGRTSPYQRTIQRHDAMHKKHSYKCETCAEVFWFRSHLKKHMVTHVSK